jgi:hypothetical protein
VREAARGAPTTEILEQPGPARVAAATDQREQLRLFAEDVAVRLDRVAPLLAVVSAAAPSEPRLAELLRELHDARLRNLRAVPALVGANGPLRLPAEDAAETIWALASPELYLLLTRVRGWSNERYAAWLADGLAALVLPS